MKEETRLTAAAPANYSVLGRAKTLLPRIH